MLKWIDELDEQKWIMFENIATAAAVVLAVVLFIASYCVTRGL